MPTYLKRSVDDAINWSMDQIENPTEDWYNKCQRHCRMAYGVNVWGYDPNTGSNSAWGAWKQIPDGKKVKTSNPSKAPRGSLIYYKGGDYGHVTIAIGKSTNDKCLGNDYVRHGKIDKCSTRDLPHWGLEVVGYSYWTPEGEMKPWVPPYWDGQYPSEEGSQLASDDPSIANPQAWRWACRLADLGWYSGEPQPKYEQGWPRMAVEKYQRTRGYAVTGDYGPKLYKQTFGREPV